MKTLVLVRHAKSSWEFDVSDRERPLKKRGNTDANLVANEFLKQNFEPDFVYSSPANRALSTCKIFVEILNIPEQKLNVVEDLYDFGGQSVINFLRRLPDHQDNVMIFGHNHAFTSLVNLLGTEYVDNLPTSGLAMIGFEMDSWSDIKDGETKLLLFPRHLK